MFKALGTARWSRQWEGPTMSGQDTRCTDVEVLEERGEEVSLQGSQQWLSEGGEAILEGGFDLGQ